LHTQRTRELIRGDSFFRFGNQRNGEEPFREGQVGVMVDGARGGGEMEAAFVAMVELAVG